MPYKDPEKAKQNHIKNRDKRLKRRREHYQENKERFNKIQSNWYHTHKEIILQNLRDEYPLNRETILLRNKRWKATHRKQYNDYVKERIKKDPNLKIREILRNRLKATIKRVGGIKSDKTLNLTGCSLLELKIHLESKFYPHPDTGEMMTWENRGFYGWHIDHIIPCIKFDLTDPEQQKKCFHYTNLQPLWRKDNLIKADN